MIEKEKNRLDNMLVYENELNDQGFNYVCGVDEAGRGPLCGPVVTAAVILKKDVYIEGINDSKKLTEKKRELLYDKIIENCLSYNITCCDVDIIEDINILNATKLSMKNSVEGLSIKTDYVLIDGNQKIDIKTNQKTIVSGDSKSLSIAAASILAKVYRDRLLLEYDKKYPEYNFAKHKGYGTKEHIENIKKYGLCEIHRNSFCKKFVD
jgi:ribonuclease HII